MHLKLQFLRTFIKEVIYSGYQLGAIHQRIKEPQMNAPSTQINLYLIQTISAIVLLISTFLITSIRLICKGELIVRYSAALFLIPRR